MTSIWLRQSKEQSTELKMIKPTNRKPIHTKLVETHGWDDMGTPVPLTDKETSQNAVERFNAKDRLIGYICRDCAMGLGGEWPDHHVATMHSGACSVCDQTKSICSPSDWQLGSDGKRRKITSMEWD